VAGWSEVLLVTIFILVLLDIRPEVGKRVGRLGGRILFTKTCLSW
jgi:hypothetical protein